MTVKIINITKYLFMSLLACSFVAAMEHTHTGVSDSVEQQIVTLITNSVNPLQAIDAFHSLLAQDNIVTDADVYAFLNRASNKFPDQEIRFARLIDNKAAEKWLSKARPLLVNYRPIEPSETDLNKAFSFIEKRQHPQLKQWLNQGYNPNARDEDISLLFKAIKFSDLESIKQLIEYGADVNQPYRLDTPEVQTPLAIIKIFQNLGMGNGHVYRLIADYIRKQGGHE